MLKIALAFALSVVAVPTLAQVKLEAQDVGEIYQTNTGHSSILLTNAGTKPVKILSVTPAYDKDGVGAFKLPATVASKTSVSIPVTVFTAMAAGARNHLFNIVTDDLNAPKLQVQVRFFGLSVLDEPAPKADIGTVNTNAAAPTKTVALSSREVPDFRIMRIIETPDFATANVLPDGCTLSITGKTDASWGLHEGFVKVALDSAVQPQAWIEVKADVHGEVIPSANPVAMGLFRTLKIPFVVQLKSRDGNPVMLGKISLEGIKAKVTKEPCVGDAAGCAQISVKVAEDQATGVVRGKLLVELPDFHQRLPIDMGGFYLPESVKVHSLNEAMAKNGKSSTEPPPLNLKDALQRSTEPKTKPPLADPPGTGPLLKWQTSNESVVYGYLIYRADTENGQYLRVNKDIVRVTGDGSPGDVSTYAWRDASATPGKTYWYYVGLINKDGSKQQLSGPQKVVAK